MRTKESVLALLEERRGEYVTGAAIAKGLNITRSAVWKAIEALRGEGHTINALPRRGYSLLKSSTRLHAAAVSAHMRHKADIRVFDTLSSTNDYARTMAQSGAAEGTIIIANEQEAGRGRRGRSFFSPGGGLYMSLILRPRLSPQESLLITTAAAAAAAEAIEEIAGEKCAIKWVNDVYIRGKKVCGILTEASVSLETGTLEYAVLGIGVNVAEPPCGYPAEISSIAAAVFKKEEGNVKSRLAALIADKFFDFYENLSDKAYLAPYRARLYAKGEEVSVMAQPPRSAHIVDVDDDFALIVRYDDGSEERLQSGEISIKVK